jgi:hypothetical protein
MSVIKTTLAAIVFTGAMGVAAIAQNNQNTLDAKVPLNTQAPTGTRAAPDAQDRAEQRVDDRQNRTVDGKVPLNTQAPRATGTVPGPTDRAEQRVNDRMQDTTDDVKPNNQAPGR